MVTSPHLLEELEELLERKFGFSRAAAVETRAELESIGVLVNPMEIQKVCRDPDDDHVLAAAVAGDVVWLVTGDKDLLALERYQAVEIVTPEVFARRLGKESR